MFETQMVLFADKENIVGILKVEDLTFEQTTLCQLAKDYLTSEIKLMFEITT